LTGAWKPSSIKWKAEVWLPLLLILVMGCRQGRYAPDGKFVDLYVELKLATVAFAADLDKVNEVRRVILAQHGMTPSQFHERCAQLMAHPETWRAFQEQVIRKADEAQNSRKGAENGK
jgi:hypothetical protein